MNSKDVRNRLDEISVFMPVLNPAPRHPASIVSTAVACTSGHR